MVLLASSAAEGRDGSGEAACRNNAAASADDEVTGVCVDVAEAFEQGPRPRRSRLLGAL